MSESGALSPSERKAALPSASGGPPDARVPPEGLLEELDGSIIGTPGALSPAAVGAPAVAAISWRRGALAATALTIARPRLWVLALVAFLARGGLAALALPDRRPADVRRAGQLRRAGLGLGGGTRPAAGRPRGPGRGDGPRPRRRRNPGGGRGGGGAPPGNGRRRGAAGATVERGSRRRPGRDPAAPAPGAAGRRRGRCRARLDRRRLPRADPAERRGRTPAHARPRRRAGGQRRGPRDVAGRGGRRRLRGPPRWSCWARRFHGPWRAGSSTRCGPRSARPSR